MVYLLPDESSATTRAGFVVGRKVGGSVVRHRVLRRLRALLRTRLDELPQGARVVVRALPAAAGGNSAELARELDRALDRAARAARRPGERVEVSH